jgi:hypothetical protein
VRPDCTSSGQGTSMRSHTECKSCAAQAEHCNCTKQPHTTTRLGDHAGYESCFADACKCEVQSHRKARVKPGSTDRCRPGSAAVPFNASCVAALQRMCIREQLDVTQHDEVVQSRKAHEYSRDIAISVYTLCMYISVCSATLLLYSLQPL